MPPVPDQLISLKGIVSPEALVSGIDESAVKIICPNIFLDFAITVTGLSPEETPGIGPEPGREPT